jgi:predicted ATPase
VTSVPGRYPLATWRLGGFRSIGEETSFELGGLNILIGANSAGKSSVLYSLLMVAQTLANPLSDRPLVLNGHLVRLGLAGDVVHGTERSSVRVGFNLEPTIDFATPGVPKQGFDALGVSASFEISPTKDLALSETRIVASRDGQQQTLTVKPQERAEALKRLQEAKLAEDLVESWLATNLLAVSGDVSTNAVGAERRQFLPTNIWNVINSYEREVDYLLFSLNQYAGTQRRQLRSLPISPETLTFLREALSEANEPAAAGELPVDESVTTDQLVPALADASRAALRTLLTGNSPQLAARMPFYGVGQPAGLPGTIAGAVEYARKWFGEYLYHIGPLRAAPQPLYELPLAASEVSVGRNGEFTAAILSAHGKRRVVSPNPAGGAARQKSLTDAVNEWVKFLDLLASVRVAERGKLGYELHVAIEGVDVDLDLTTVGVGVSQALPIIVLGLIAPPGSLLLFEQPELHLHPDVQANLGDFFLALSRTGRQLIVETHSEYLVNRLRRRAAEDAESEIPEEVRLFFFERDGARSSVQAGRIGPRGGMQGWPRGFFDTASREVEAIAMANKPES